MVELPLPAVIGDVALIVDCAAETALAPIEKDVDVAPVRPPLDAASV